MTLKEALNKSIRHWQRMIKWAKTQNLLTKPNHRDLWLGLQTVWNHGSCDVCHYYFKHLDERCVLNPQCRDKARKCHPEWNALNFSQTWEAWIEHAEKFTAVLKQCRKEIKNGKAKSVANDVF